MKKILLASIFSLSFLSNANAISEMNYEINYQQKIVPVLKSMKEGFFSGANNVYIHYRTLIKESGTKNCLVILPGRSEPIEKYAEVVYDLMNSKNGANLSFYLMDHRGQGSSGRMKTPTDMGYVDSFENYVTDLETFTKTVNLDQNCDRKFLLAHSMGAGIATDFILKHPGYFERVALSSPMLKIMTKPYSYGVARSIVELSTIAGKGAAFAIGQKGFNPEAKFENNTFTTSSERFKMTMDTFGMYPVAKLGGASNKWILEVMKATNSIRSRYHEIAVPLRIYHAGLEAYSEPSEMVKICDEAVDCKRMLFPNSKHEVMMDRDETREVVLASLVEFFN